MLIFTQSCAELGRYPCFLHTVRSVGFVPVPHSNLSKDDRLLLLRPLFSSSTVILWRLQTLCRRIIASFWTGEWNTIPVFLKTFLQKCPQLQHPLNLPSVNVLTYILSFNCFSELESPGSGSLNAGRGQVPPFPSTHYVHSFLFHVSLKMYN